MSYFEPEVDFLYFDDTIDTVTESWFNPDGDITVPAEEFEED